MSTNIDPKRVHILGVYFGHKDPTAECLLRCLVEELTTLLASGYVPKSQLPSVAIPLQLHYITADLPAIALVKGLYRSGD